MEDLRISKAMISTKYVIIINLLLSYISARVLNVNSWLNIRP